MNQWVMWPLLVFTFDWQITNFIYSSFRYWTKTLKNSLVQRWIISAIVIRWIFVNWKKTLFISNTFYLKPQPNSWLRATFGIWPALFCIDTILNSWYMLNILLKYFEVLNSMVYMYTTFIYQCFEWVFD